MMVLFFFLFAGAMLNLSAAIFIWLAVIIAPLRSQVSYRDTICKKEIKIIKLVLDKSFFLSAVAKN